MISKQDLAVLDKITDSLPLNRFEDVRKVIRRAVVLSRKETEKRMEKILQEEIEKSRKHLDAVIAFSDKVESKSGCMSRKGKLWFSAKEVFEIVDWAKNASGLDAITVKQIEKKLRFLSDKHTSKKAVAKK